MTTNSVSLSRVEGKPLVLVTDDSVSTVMVLREVLEQSGLRVHGAHDGASAVYQMEQTPPDLLLLDVVMPGMDGYEICRRLKANPRLRHVPVIFMTGLTDEQAKLECFDAGGVDYIAKPLQLKEVLARVHTHLELHAMQRRLAQQNHALQRQMLARAEVEASLEDLVERRTADLAQRTQALEESLAQQQRMQEHMVKTEIMASLGRLVGGLAHEINAPVGVAFTAATQIGDELRRFQAGVESGQVTRARLERFTSNAIVMADVLAVNCARAVELVRRLKSGATDRSSEQRRRFQLGELVRETMASLEPQLRKHDIEVKIEAAQEVAMDSYPGALSQVLINLATNALDHAFGANGGNGGAIGIRIAASGPDEVMLSFADNGGGIAEELLPRVFEPFFTTRREAGNSGLGLHIVASLVSGPLGGKIALDSTPGVGTVCKLTLPLKP